MGKRQHQKDKLYITCTEWSTLYGGKAAAAKDTAEKREFRRLPYDHCSLNLQPFENPYCSPEGHIFDLLAIIPYLKKYKTNPVTGKPLDVKDLIKLNFHKNNEGHYHCPILYRSFTSNSHIVAIRITGNVMSYEAVEELNIKVKNWKELLTDEPFTRNDIIHIQDPADLTKFNLETFIHLKNNLKVEDEDERQAKSNPLYHLKVVSNETKDTLDQLKKEYKPAEEEPKPEKVFADELNAAHFSTGMVAAALTSTVMEPQTKQEAAIIDEDEIKYRRVKKKGYARLITNLGPINLELHCDLVPRTCDNFLQLCQKNVYNKTIFHRSIRNFMIQGGDPTNTGHGGYSIWRRPFPDEFKPQLTHTGRGILSMANTGPNTNASQFFITFRSCRHLDRKHTIFGRVVGGMETLNTMERIPTDEQDKPIHDIIIERTEVFINPFIDAEENLKQERVAVLNKKQQEEEQKQKPILQLREYHKGVGKYINLTNNLLKTQDIGTETQPNLKKKKIIGYEFKEFSGW